MIKKQKTNQYSTKVLELLGKMTLEEKVAQLGAYYIYDLQTKSVLNQSKIELKLKDGIGQITRIGGAANYPPAEAAKTANRLQRFLREKTRLGIPAIVHEECCAGLMAPCSTIFPQMIGLASTFQPELAGEMTAMIREQMLAIGSRQGLAPVLDVARDPRWGRVEETFGEDPTLVSRFGVEYIKGLQSGDLRKGVMATGKHFVGHSFSEGGLNCAPVHIGWNDLWDVYLAPFQAAIRDAGLASMMNAYPELDGEVVAASKAILTGLLRKKLGFRGVVVSDYEAVMMIHNYHFAAKTRKEAAIKALNAGIDVELPSVTCYGNDLIEAVKSGELSIKTIDLAVERHLQKKFELGLFENPYVDEDNCEQKFDSLENRELAYQIACKSLVLLKNDGVLPLSATGSKIAVIGPNADSTRSLMGDYSFAALAELMKIVPNGDSAFEAMTDAELEGLTVKIPTLLDTLKQKLPSATIHYAMGCDIMSEDESGLGKAVKTALDSDIVILVVGGRSGLAPQNTTGEFRDATDLRLPGVQEKLVKAIQATGKPTVLVLIDGRPVAMPELVEGSNAILEAWVPGEEGARAIVDTLLGDVNPGGKLPISVPRSAGQLPVYYNHKPSGRRSNIYGDYYNESVNPLFAFGHGLSYTNFEYGNLKIEKSEVKAGQIVDISLEVQNSGKVTGDEVVQLYICDEFASLPRPVKELKGFTRVTLTPGRQKKIVFHLPVNQLAYYDADFELIVEPGTVKVMIGSSSTDIRLEGEFEVTDKTNTKVNDRVFVCPVSVF